VLIATAWPMRGRTVWLQVWFKNRRAKCRQQQKAAEQVSKTAAHVHHQQRPNSAGSVSNSSPTGGVRLPVGAAVDGDGTGVSSAAAATSDDDVDDDRLLYRHHGSGGLLMASSAARPSCGWVPASLPPFLRQSSDTFAGPYRVGPRLHAGAGYSSAAAAMFVSRSGGYPGSPYGSGGELGGYGAGGWSVSVTQEAYCNGAAGGGGETCVQFPETVGSTSMSYGAAAVPLFVASPYDHAPHHSHHHHAQHYQQQHQQHKQQLDDDDLDDDAGEFEVENSRRVALQSADENKDWIKYQPL